MFTRIKTPSEITNMRESGRILAAVLQQIEAMARPGVTGKDVSELAKRELRGFGATGSFLGYPGMSSAFPDVICISVNDEVVHGIPNKKEFKDGDIVSFDFGVTYNGMVTDSAFSMCIGGDPSKKQARLLKATEQSMYAGIETLRDGVRTGTIGAAIERVLDAAGVGIVRDFVGHGVGHAVHEDPNIPNYGTAGTGHSLRAGMTIAIEPMATLGREEVAFAADDWTVVTADHSLAAHFEHTVLITRDGYEILTAWQ